MTLTEESMRCVLTRNMRVYTFDAEVACVCIVEAVAADQRFQIVVQVSLVNGNIFSLVFALRGPSVSVLAEDTADVGSVLPLPTGRRVQQAAGSPFVQLHLNTDNTVIAHLFRNDFDVRMDREGVAMRAEDGHVALRVHAPSALRRLWGGIAPSLFG